MMNRVKKSCYFVIISQPESRYSFYRVTKVKGTEVRVWRPFQRLYIAVKSYFHFGCALRCVAIEIETLSASLYLTPRNATRSQNGNKL